MYPDPYSNRSHRQPAPSPAPLPLVIPALCVMCLEETEFPIALVTAYGSQEGLRVGSPLRLGMILADMAPDHLASVTFRKLVTVTGMGGSVTPRIMPGETIELLACTMVNGALLCAGHVRELRKTHR